MRPSSQFAASIALYGEIDPETNLRECPGCSLAATSRKIYLTFCASFVYSVSCAISTDVFIDSGK